MTPKRCSINYHRMKIKELELFAEGVMLCYYKHNPPFTAPVIPLADFETLVKDYNETYAAFKNGGKLQKGHFGEAKDALIKGLDEIAENVNEVAQGDENIIIEGGFKPTKTNRSEKNIPQVPEIESLAHGVEGQILATCKMLDAEIHYGCIISEGAPLDEGVKLFAGKLTIPVGLKSPIQIDETKARKKSFINLKIAVRYYVYFFARNSAGVSGLSEGRSIICT